MNTRSFGSFISTKLLTTAQKSRIKINTGSDLLTEKEWQLVFRKLEDHLSMRLFYESLNADNKMAPREKVDHLGATVGTLNRLIKQLSEMDSSDITAISHNLRMDSDKSHFAERNFAKDLEKLLGAVKSHHYALVESTSSAKGRKESYEFTGFIFNIVGALEKTAIQPSRSPSSPFYRLTQSCIEILSDGAISNPDRHLKTALTKMAEKP